MHTLKFEDFQTALRIQSNGNTVRDNRIEASNVGIRIESGAAGNLIGGSADSGHGNRTWSTLTGIQLQGAGAGNEIAGNTIGLDPEGSPTDGETGIDISAASGTIVGDDAFPGDLFVMDFDRGNVISGLVGEAGDAIVLGTGATGTRVTGNFIGTNRAGTADLGNNGRGIDVFDANDNQLGPGTASRTTAASASGSPARSGTASLRTSSTTTPAWASVSSRQTGTSRRRR